MGVGRGAFCLSLFQFLHNGHSSILSLGRSKVTVGLSIFLTIANRFIGQLAPRLCSRPSLFCNCPLLLIKVTGVAGVSPSECWERI